VSSIRIIDLFAGPGGLGEGFASLKRPDGRPAFDIRLSIEKDPYAHRTLTLRSFFRQFPDGAPEEYYQYVRGSGEITREQLFETYSEQAEAATREAWCAELGGKYFPNDLVREHISSALGRDSSPWVLIGGPPCQAYSVVGRVRMRNIRRENYSFEDDHRHFLYREYLRIIADHRPDVFIMENVRGMLTSRLKEEGIFDRICRDLKAPTAALAREENAYSAIEPLEYQVYPIAVEGGPGGFATNPADYIVRSEQHGVPQARHRVFLLGVRNGIPGRPIALPTSNETIALWDVISDLPRIRSRLSREVDSTARWEEVIKEGVSFSWRYNEVVPRSVSNRINELAAGFKAPSTEGGKWIAGTARVSAHSDWFNDAKIGGFLNHEARGHMADDLIRYFYASIFAEVTGRSPRLSEFPSYLYPEHRNIKAAVSPNGIFNDRFRVQLKDRPATTIVSHISKDGHYFIHPDPTQCRSLTVREAARIQTFPDNYFFEGPRTSQYHQVGNAVPPLLAHQIAHLIADFLNVPCVSYLTPILAAQSSGDGADQPQKDMP
jgi:DNA (cytosine-5)-methyltransferase 1